MKHLTDAAKVIGVIRNSLHTNLIYLVDNSKTPRENFANICKRFEKDQSLERQITLKKITRIKFKSLSSYINAFKNLLAEYLAVGGSLDDENLKWTFLNGRFKEDMNSSLKNKTLL